MTPQSVRVVLTADPGSVSYARLFVRRQCEVAALDADACEDAVLLTSETVTGALLGGRGRPTLTVTTRPGWVRVEVGGVEPVAGPQPAGLPLPSRSAELVERLATSWGRGDADGRHALWFEVAAPPRPVSPVAPLQSRPDSAARLCG